VKRRSLAALLPLALALTAASAGAGDDLETRLQVGRPANFSGAVGVYWISYAAAPTKVAVEDSVTLTVRITGSGPKGHLPERSRLRLFPAEVARDFYVEDVPDKDRVTAVPEKDRHHPEETQAWEFTYRLKPKHLKVKHLPALEFAYFHARYQRFQKARTREYVALEVTPPGLADVPVTVKMPQAPARFYELTTGAAVLGRGGPDAGFNVPLLLGLLLAPPLLCLAWYGAWRRLHPGAGWRVRRHRSRAAREVLAALGALGADAPGERSAALLAGYLRQRLELHAAEPTPAEVATHLGRVGVSAAVSERAAAFFRACDAARFAPAPPAGRSALTADAGAIVNALEAELCTWGD
jgi:hypothetical protein